VIALLHNCLPSSVGIIGVNEVVVPVVQNLLERADNTDAKIANLDERVKHLATSSLVYLDTPGTPCCNLTEQNICAYLANQK
jgi:hypothetical protein